MGTLLHRALKTGFTAGDAEAGPGGGAAEGAAPRCGAASLEPGDLILVTTPGRGYAFGRRIARNPYDHIAVVLDGGLTMNIVPPRCRAVPAETLLARRPECLVLRPGWRDQCERERFTVAMAAFEDRPYDMRRALVGIALNTLYVWTAVPVRLRRPGTGTERWVCTEAILEHLGQAMPDFRSIRALPLDYYRLGFSTTNDFLRVSRLRPDLLSPQ